MFGPRPVFIGGDHYFAVKGKSVRFLHPKDRENWEKIIIEDEVWCGACIIIPKGVIVGMGAVIGAGSVLTKNIPPYTVAVGNPCKPIKKIFDDKDLYEHIIKIGYDEKFAKDIVNRRNNELELLKLVNIPVINKTEMYWEYKEGLLK